MFALVAEQEDRGWHSSVSVTMGVEVPLLLTLPVCHDLSEFIIYNVQLLKSAISHMFHSSDAKSDSPSYHICLLFFFAASICLNISFFIFGDMSVSGEFYSASLQMFRVSCVNYRKSPWIHCLQFFCICHLEDHYSTAHQYYLRMVASITES